MPEVAAAIREYLTFRDNGKTVEKTEGRPLFESSSNNSAGRRINCPLSTQDY